MKALSNNSLILFYCFFLIFTGIATFGYGQSMINNADFINKDIKHDISNDFFNSVGFLLFAGVPTTSNIYMGINILRFLNIIVAVYTLLVAFIIVKIIRGTGD